MERLVGRSDVVRSLEVAVREITLKPRPEPKRLLDVTMRLLAEECNIESILEKSKDREVMEEAKEILKKLKDMKHSLLRVYFSSILRGEFKSEYMPAIASLKGKEEWSRLQEMR